MPAYFAYGSNMHAEGLRARCPRSRAVATAELPEHAFYLMASSGYASVRPEPWASVHGVLIDLAEADLAALDDYEDIASGLYVKANRELRLAGGGTVSALVYLGGDLDDGGTAPAGYMECVLAAARDSGLPPAYVARIASLAAPPSAAGVARW